MIEREEERLIWQYLDGQLSREEEEELMLKAQVDPELRQYIDRLKDIENVLTPDYTYAMSDALKNQILSRTIYKHQRSLSLADINWRNLKSFIVFNVLILMAGLALTYFNYRQIIYTQSSILEKMKEALQQPLSQTISLIFIGVLSLLALDQFFVKKVYQRTTTPV